MRIVVSGRHARAYIYGHRAQRVNKRCVHTSGRCFSCTLTERDRKSSLTELNESKCLYYHPLSSRRLSSSAFGLQEGW